MKRTKTLMLIYIFILLAVMFFFEKHYDYDWTPATPNKNYIAESSSLVEKVKEQRKNETASTEVQTAEQSVLEENKEETSPLSAEEQLKEKNLVDIETLTSDIFLDMRYATENNFTKTKLYQNAKCYLKEPAAKALVQAAAYAREEAEPFYLCIYDCYRPDSVQKTMLNSTGIKGYLSRISNHSRGMAVDLGPCDKDGKPLATPTEFDTFSRLSAAYIYDKQIPQEAIKNRTALQNVMKKAGFTIILNEWWHFNYKDAKKEEILDIKI